MPYTIFNVLGEIMGFKELSGDGDSKEVVLLMEQLKVIVDQAILVLQVAFKEDCLGQNCQATWEGGEE